MASEDQVYAALTGDGAGGAIVTWCDLRYSDSYNIYAQRVDAAGVVQWMLDGVSLCTATDNQWDPMIVSDGAGGAIVAWWDYRSGTSCDIYAQRVDAHGSAPATGADAPAVSIALDQNYPNPFNPMTTVTYSIPEKCNVMLDIYDASGKRVQCLVHGEREKGSYRVEWDGRDDQGNSVASGIFFYRLTAGNQTISRKLVLVR
jgi:hypothetical protein